VNGESEKQIVDSLGRLHGKMDVFGEKLEDTRLEARETKSEVKGQRRWIQDLQERHDRETREQRSAIAGVSERVVRVEQRQENQADVTGRQAAAVPAPPQTPSLRTAVNGTVEVARWKAITAIGVPLALAVAAAASHFFR
jgi:hypothetical protein